MTRLNGGSLRHSVRITDDWVPRWLRYQRVLCDGGTVCTGIHILQEVAMTDNRELNLNIEWIEQVRVKMGFSSIKVTIAFLERMIRESEARDGT